MSARVAIAKGVAAVALCLIGILGLSFAWIGFVFSGDASPGHEAGAIVKSVMIAIVTVGIVGTGLYLLFRGPRPTSLSAEGATGQYQTTCGACGTRFPSHLYLQDAGTRGYICSDCAKNMQDARDQV